jgi:uncharacterized protein
MPSPLETRLQTDLNEARKARDRSRTSLLSMTLSELGNRRIELGRELTDTDVEEVLSKARKRRQEAAEQMRAGGRVDLAEKEEEEERVLAAYLPEPLGEEEVRALVRELLAGGASDVGALMGALMPRIRGRFDGREANRIAREELAGA